MTMDCHGAFVQFQVSMNTIKQTYSDYIYSNLLKRAFSIFRIFLHLEISNTERLQKKLHFFDRVFTSPEI